MIVLKKAEEMYALKLCSGYKVELHSRGGCIYVRRDDRDDKSAMLRICRVGMSRVYIWSRFEQ